MVVKVLGDDALRMIARELVATKRDKSRSIGRFPTICARNFKGSRSTSSQAWLPAAQARPQRLLKQAKVLSQEWAPV
jgi:hypothetical protein